MARERFRSLAAAGLLLLALLAGCADDPVAVAAIEDGARVIDVRTPEEFEARHVVDAINVDLSDPGFEEAVSELDPDTSYVVYCRTGRRSAEAVATMTDLGFTDVVDGGALADLAEQGLSTDR